jgi:hypothetical protein
MSQLIASCAGSGFSPQITNEGQFSVIGSVMASDQKSMKASSTCAMWTLASLVLRTAGSLVLVSYGESAERCPERDLPHLLLDLGYTSGSVISTSLSVSRSVAARGVTTFVSPKPLVENCAQSLMIGEETDETGDVALFPFPWAALSLLRSRILLKGEERLGTGDATSIVGDMIGEEALRDVDARR